MAINLDSGYYLAIIPINVIKEKLRFQHQMFLLIFILDVRNDFRIFLFQFLRHVNLQYFAFISKASSRHTLKISELENSGNFLSDEKTAEKNRVKHGYPPWKNHNIWGHPKYCDFFERG